MKNAPRKSTPRSRSVPRKKADALAATQAKTPVNPPPEATPGNPNVGRAESAFSLGLGVLLLVGALFPRSLKQLVLLGLGGGLVYRGLSRRCGVYQALGINTERGSLLAQVNDKYLAPVARDAAS